MIKFKYEVDNGMAGLIRSTFADVVNPNMLVGYVEKEKLANIDLLRHNSLFLVCDCVFSATDDTPSDYKNPIAVVAKNQSEAIGIYNNIFKTDEGIVMCELKNRCDELEVESI